MIAPLFSYFHAITGPVKSPAGQTANKGTFSRKEAGAGLRGQTPHSRPAASWAPSCPPTRLGFELPQTLPAAAQQLVQLPHSGNWEHSTKYPTSLPPVPIFGVKGKPLFSLSSLCSGSVSRTHTVERQSRETQRWNPCPNAFGKRQTENSPPRVSV